MNNEKLEIKLEHWKHSLLDLTKGNKMIHYTPTSRQSLGITVPDYEELYTKLVANGETLTFQREIDRESDIRLFSFMSLLQELSVPLVVSVGDIKTTSSFSEANKTLKNLRKISNAAIQEKGSNILYLSFGFLEWRTTSGDWVKSPLVLVPVTLTIPPQSTLYQLKKHQDEVLINPSLNYYCNTKYGFDLPSFNETEDTPGEYLNIMEELANQRGWKLNAEVCLGVLSFQKISMYNDLIMNEDRIKNSPIIRAMAEGIDESEEVFKLPDHMVDFNLDTLVPQESFQVMSADSSQQDAILYSKNNMSFVMQGPPGTGKSQTIANIIAEALAADKQILFVAEKATALQVVLKRLSDVNLADFCLTLHSSEAKKRSILDELEANLKLKQTKVKELALSQLDELSFLRDDLNAYGIELHQTIPPLDISCYEASGRLAELLPYPSLSFDIENVEGIIQKELHSYTKALTEYSNAVDRLDRKIINNPWEGLSTRNSGYEFSETMKKSLTQIIYSLDSNIALFPQISPCQTLEKKITIGNIEDYFRFIELFFDAPLFPVDSILERTSEELQEHLSLTLRTKDKYALQAQLQQLLCNVFQEDVKAFDASAWSEELFSLETSLAKHLNYENSSSGEIIKNMISLRNTLEVVSEALDQVEGIFLDINARLGTKLPPCAQSLKLLEDLSLVIKENQPLPSQLFLGSKENLKEMRHLGEINTNELAKVHSKILENWEESILEFDYTSMLQRFKVDYDSEFLETSKNYSADFRKFKSMFKGASSFYVDAILKVLEAIAEWTNSKQILQDNQSAFEESLDFCQRYGQQQSATEALKETITEDWDESIFLKEHRELLQRFTMDYDKAQKILKGKQYFADKKEIQSFYEYTDKVTSELVEDLLESLAKYDKENEWLLSNKVTYESGNDIIKKQKSLMEMVENLQKNITLDWESDILTMDLEDYTRRYSNVYDAEFKKLYTNYNSDIKLLESNHKDFQKKVTYDIAVELLKQLSEYSTKEKWFQSKSNEFQDKFGFFYKGKNTSWSLLNCALDKVNSIRELLQYDVPTSLTGILENDYNAHLCQLNLDVSKLTKLFHKITENLQENHFITDKEVDFVNSKKENVTDALNLCEKISQKWAQVDPFYKNSTVGMSEALVCFDALIQYSVLNQKLVANDKELELCLGDYYKKSATHWSELIMLLELTKELKGSSLLVVVAPILKSDQERKDEILGMVSQMKKDFSLSRDDQNWLCSNFSNEYKLNERTFPELSKKLKDCFENIHYLLPWIDYEEAKSHCITLGLGSFITVIEESGTYLHIDKVFLREFYRRWLDIMGNRFDFVRKFRRNNHDSNVNKFVELDKQQWVIAQSRIREKLIANLPTEHQKLSKANDELSVLRRELDKKQKFLPLRTLFARIPNLLLRLKPCLMMSPLSVSTLLEANSYEFDLLIFDEASQIFPEDAIGSLLRAKQVIVAGDSKQLPPYNFFKSMSSSDDDEHDREEETQVALADSILEESVKILHNRTLRWHYRSKYESLITFSNREIYKNNLITFPSKELLEENVGLEFVYVEDGFYESGSSKRRNMKEAETCVRLVHNHILTCPNRTLGIITFSKNQQITIETMLNKFRQNYPQFEYFFDETKHEPFFVKNLENVQGDERDTILFSVCYGKEQGKEKMSMYFGPLSKLGGERRLNVAITRAKYNMKLIASILPGDFHITENSPQGTKLLRSFIEFAHLLSGQDIPFMTKERDNRYDTDDFVHAISSLLQSRGYVTKEYVGDSEYKIDITVENPRSPGEYSVAIECDGICYIDARTARDRDHLRGSMLDAMGWKKYRIWSTEWIRNTEKEERSLLEFIEKAYAPEELTEENLEGNKQETSIELLKMTDYLEESEPIVEDVDMTNPLGFAYYQSFSGFDPVDFCDMYEYKKIGDNVRKILVVDSPLPKDALFRKVLPALKSEKLTASVKKTLQTVLENVIQDEISVDEDEFVWLLPKKEPEVRIPRSGTTERPFEDISTMELSKALFLYAEYLYGPSLSVLTTEVIRIYGVGRNSKKIKEKVEVALKLLLHQNKIKIIDDKVMIIK